METSIGFMKVWIASAELCHSSEPEMTLATSTTTGTNLALAKDHTA